MTPKFGAPTWAGGSRVPACRATRRSSSSSTSSSPASSPRSTSTSCTRRCRRTGASPSSPRYTRAESIDEMKHAEVLTDRILFLEGLPNYQRLFPLRIGQTVREQFESDLAVEVEAVDRLRRGIEYMRRESATSPRAEPLRGDPRRRGAPHRLPRDPARADRQARRAALPGAAGRAAVELSGSRRPVHTPLIASIRPSRMAVSSAAWSRSFWSAYASAKSHEGLVERRRRARGRRRSRSGRRTGRARGPASSRTARRTSPAPPGASSSMSAEPLPSRSCRK